MCQRLTHSHTRTDSFFITATHKGRPCTFNHVHTHTDLQLIIAESEKNSYVTGKHKCAKHKWTRVRASIPRRERVNVVMLCCNKANNQCMRGASFCHNISKGPWTVRGNIEEIFCLNLSSNTIITGWVQLWKIRCFFVFFHLACLCSHTVHPHICILRFYHIRVISFSPGTPQIWDRMPSRRCSPVFNLYELQPVLFPVPFLHSLPHLASIRTTKHVRFKSSNLSPSSPDLE